MVTLVSGSASAISQLVVLPTLSHYFGIRVVLFLGLFTGALHVRLQPLTGLYSCQRVPKQVPQ